MSPVRCSGQVIESKIGSSLFDYADAINVRVPTSCGRNGQCHECIVEINSGHDSLNNPTEEEFFLGNNFRLACQTKITDTDKVIEFSILRRQPRILVESINRRVSHDPMVQRNGDTVSFNGSYLDKYRNSILGIAADIGTTTIVMNLVDLETSNILATSSFENPQKFGGSDIMNRISYDGGKFSGELRQVMLSALNFEIGELTKQSNLHRRQIYEAVFVGNSTMRDLLFNYDVQSIGQKPYRSITESLFLKGEIDSTALNIKAKDFGLRVFPDANIYGGPLIGSHVGSDVAADILATAMGENDEISMLVDIGTNTEVVLGNSNKMIVASCPAGPAFEGGEISYGMPGYDGAIESLTFSETGTKYKTIGNKKPQGICGSGLIQILSELRRTKQMNELGVFEKSKQKIVLAPDQEISISRSDVSSLAQAKSANYSGQFITMRSYGVNANQISKLYLAGGFANYIVPECAIDIGFLPNISSEKITKVGNASLEGATIMLKSKFFRKQIEEKVKLIDHIELETCDDFFEIFVEGCMFKPMPKILA
ncbi:MAG: ASKHA domain-containing protein [Dehalococcoidia bacterium]